MNVPPFTTCLVSACLMGLCTRYDGIVKPDSQCINFIQNFDWIPVCPEQLGGLPTPREKAILSGGNGHDVLAGAAQVVSISGKDVSEHFIRGAEQVLKIAQAKSITTAILKSRSPSCAVTGSIGVTAALLQTHGLKLIEY